MALKDHAAPRAAKGDARPTRPQRITNLTWYSPRDAGILCAIMCGSAILQIIRHKLGPVLALPLVLSACSGTATPDPALEGRMTSMFDAVYEEVSAVHLNPLDLRKFTIGGLDGLLGFDSGFELTVDDEDFRIEIAGDIAAVGVSPDDDADIDDWSAFARHMVLDVHMSDLLPETADEEALYDHFFDSAMRTLDRYSRYANPRDAADLRAERDGFGGIGIDLEEHPDGARIERIERDKPAAAAGLLVGDRIVAIDDLKIVGMPLGAIERRMRGPVDSPISLTVVRDGLPEPLSVTVGRTRIVPNTVFYSLSGNHAVVRISGFNQRTSKRISEAISQARAELGQALSGLIIDLRGNLGGRLDQAIDSADLFLESGLITRADGRHPESHQTFNAEPGDIADGLPTIVLINGASASAAEILASALQDHGRAVVVGMSSFGKGTIQTIVDLPNSGELYVTWARYVAPSGYALHRMGVMPTVCTSGASDAVKTLETALGSGPDSGSAMLEQRRSVSAEDDSAAREVLKLCPWLPHASGDLDLSIAELILDSPALFRRALEVGRAPGGV